MKITTTSGVVSGLEVDGIQRFRGIPFARLPHRFAAPEPGAPAPIDGAAFGSAPYQDDPGYVDLGAAVSEDCLNLNVTAPAHRATGGLPVIVWLYGGGFEHGSNAIPGTDGSGYVVTGRVIFVAVNYRVGAFGWIQLAQHGGDFTAASNLGVRDVVAALQWVRENIGNFGGDPHRVTVLGQSAGAFIAAALLGLREHSGLFSALALFSGGASRVIPQERAEHLGLQFLHETGCETNPAAILDLDPAAVVNASNKVISQEISARNNTNPHALGIVDDSALDNGIMTQHPLRAVKRGLSRHVRLLICTTRDEISAFRLGGEQPFEPRSEPDLVAEVKSWNIDSGRAQSLVAHYLAQSVNLGNAREALLTDWIYRLPAARLAETQSHAGGRAYLAMVCRADAAAAHGSDVMAIVGNVDKSSATAAARSEEIIGAVLRFATGADPGWSEFANSATAKSFGNDLFDATQAYQEVLDLWKGIDRP
jgi:para-nitrobenzyl esterase